MKGYRDFHSDVDHRISVLKQGQECISSFNTNLYISRPWFNMHWMPLWEIPGKVGKKSGNLRRAGEWPPWIIIIISTSKIPALRAGILLAVLLGISYRIQIGLAYCNGPKGAGRGSEKPTCIVRLGNPGLLDRLASVRGWRAEPLCGQHSWLGPWQISASTSPLHHGLATAASHWSSAPLRYAHARPWPGP